MHVIVVLVLVLVLILLIGVLLNVIVSLVTKDLFSGAYFAETSNERLQDIFTVVKPTAKDTVLDLGSGDGRVVLAFAKQGIPATGIEINPLLVLLSLIKFFFSDAKTKANANIQNGNLWQLDFSPYSVVIIYGLPSMMPKLKKKCKKELQPGTKIVSTYFPIPGWKYNKKLNDIHLYKI